MSMERNRFGPGDVVRHDDGITMTVCGDPFEQGGRVFVPCCWFNDATQLRHGAFEEGALCPVPRAERGRAGGSESGERFPPAADVNAALRAAVDRQAARDREARGGLSAQGLAEGCYRAYGDQANWRNFLGHPMPAWDDLPDHIRDCWEAVARFALGKR